MKQQQIVFLFFCALTLFQLLSCNRKEVIKSQNQASLDSINYYDQKMRDQSISDSLCLEYANKGLEFAEDQKLIDKSANIRKYKTYLFWKMGRIDSAIAESKELIRLLVKENDKIGVAEAYTKLAYSYIINYQKDSAYYYYELSNEIYSTLKDTLKMGENLTYMAIIQSDMGDYNGSDATGIKAIKYLDKGNVKFLASVYNCLAISSKKQKDFNESIYWFDKSLSISANKIDSITILNNKANALRYLKKYDNSIFIFNELLKDPILETIPKTKAQIIDNSAYAAWLKNESAEVLSKFLLALKIRQEENDLMGLIASYAHLSDYYKLINKKIALNYATRMHQMAINQKSPQDQLEALQKIIDLDNSPKVKEYYTSYIRISDSLNEAERQSINKFAKLKYDSEKNREENLKLKIISSKNELDLEIEKTRNIIGVVSGGSVVFGLLIFGYFRNEKHKHEKRAEVYKTETRIAKKIHDEVANNVVNIMNKVQYTEEPKEKLLDDLEKVYLLTRNISHQNRSIETGNKFEASLKTLLTSFNNDTTTIIFKNSSDVHLEKISEINQVEIYRILQELLVNMKKHSEASLVAISFKSEQNKYFINYSDNGVGVDLNSLVFKNGLQNVETRIKSINGMVNFESSLNNGFKVFISFKN